MKALHIIDHMGMGGAQVLLPYLVRENKNSLALVLSNKKRNYLIKLPHRYFLSKSKNIISLYPILEIKNLVNKNKSELLHCHLWRSQLFGLVIKKLFFPNIKLVFHVHSRIRRFSPGWLLLFISRHNVDSFIAVSPTTEKEIISCKVRPEKIIVIPNFISPEFFTKASEASIHKKNRKHESSVTLGFIGRLHKNKGCGYLIRALTMLDDSFSLRIVGDGPEKENLKKLVESLNLRARVVFIGSINNIIDEYNKIDILVVPSTSEPFGLVWAEAQLLGIPVIASKVGGMKDFISDKKTGLLFEVGGVNELKTKILLFVKNTKLRQEIVKNAKKEVRKFNLANYIKRLNEVYEKF